MKLATVSVESPEATVGGFSELRCRARVRFREQGLPSRRVEAYKYSDLTSLAKEEWVVGSAASGLPPGLPEPWGRRLLWLNGRLLDPGESGDEIREIGAIAAHPPSGLKALIGQLTDSDDPLVNFNTMQFDHGAWIDLPAGVRPERPLELLFTHAPGERPVAAHARLALHLGANSRLVLIERHIGPDQGLACLATLVAEIDLEPGAELIHLRLIQMGTQGRMLGRTETRVGAGAGYRAFNYDAGTRLARHTLRVRLAAPGAGTSLAGIQILQDREQADNDVSVIHDATSTRSRQYFRSVLAGHSRGIYSGRIKVEPKAQKADSSQESASLLLSRQAEADTRPQLEIYADDVSCNHGASTGAIDPDSLFYLQSRGIDAANARRMIAYGFAARVFAPLEISVLKDAVTRLIADRLQAPEEVREWL